MLVFKISILLSSLLILESYGINSCSSNNCKSNKELCKYQANYQSQNPAKHCVDFEKTIKADIDRKTILNKINSRRNKVADGDIRSLPSAGNMLMLEWDRQLEMSAQRWANQCVRRSVPDIKDACRHIGDIHVGQNIASVYGESPGLMPTALVDMWYMELLNFNRSLLQRYREGICDLYQSEPGHLGGFWSNPSRESEKRLVLKKSNDGSQHYDYFTQLVWSDTSKVGCGGVKFRERYQDHNGGKNRTVYRLVCNFSPAGNRKNESVYAFSSPCSKCPEGTFCDAVYSALCSNRNAQKTGEELTNNIQRTSILPHVLKTDVFNEESISNATTKVNVSQSISITATAEENWTPYDYFSHLHDFTRQMITMTPTVGPECKDNLAVDEFIDMLRKKLSSDSAFKELIFATKPALFGATETTFTDASVAAFVNRIYSKKKPPTTMKITEIDLLNSTLLVDLVEAVIFRSGEKVTENIGIDQSTYPVSNVSPVKIQAELAQTHQNEDFTGHYFFPEDDEESDTNETTDSYYDASNLSIADVIMEIEDIRKSTVTKNFLDEILELDFSTEEPIVYNSMSPDDVNTHYSINTHKGDHDVMKKFLEDIKDKSSESVTLIAGHN